MAYVDPAVSGDETTIATDTLASVQTMIPRWQPAEGHPETAQAEATAIAIGTAVQTLLATAKDAYSYWGTNVLGMPKIPPGVATSTITVTLTAAQQSTGLTIDAGTEVDASTPDGAQVVLVTVSTVTISPLSGGSMSGIAVAAVEAGPDSNNAAGTATMNLAGVQSVTLDAPTGGGSDEETDDAYADRLAKRTPRMHIIPQSVADYAALATDVPGVGRSLAINRYDPGNPGADSPGHLTLASVQPDGTNLTDDLKTALGAYLNSVEKPLSVELHTIDPTEVDIVVTATIQLSQASVDDYGQPILADPDDTISAAEAAVQQGMDKSAWDADSTAPGGWSLVPSKDVTVFDIAAMIGQVPGVKHVESVMINGAATPVALPAPAALPNLTSVTVTIAS